MKNNIGNTSAKCSPAFPEKTVQKLVFWTIKSDSSIFLGRYAPRPPRKRVVEGASAFFGGELSPHQGGMLGQFGIWFLGVWREIWRMEYRVFGLGACVLECGGKRSATPLSHGIGFTKFNCIPDVVWRTESGVTATALQDLRRFGRFVCGKKAQ